YSDRSLVDKGYIDSLVSGTTGTSGNLYILTSITTTPVTLTNDDYVVLVDTTTSKTINLPLSPNNGQAYKIKDKTGNALDNNITVSGNGNDIDGNASYTIDTNYGGVEVVYSSGDGEWYTLSFIN
ncbi:MAG: hypothetical protein ACOCZ5_03685, partial [bacterium]